MASPTEDSVDAFLAALASGAPAPGGGAASALCGALAAALVAMVSRVTAAREREGTAAGALMRPAEDLRARLAGLVAEDMNAYRGVLAARRAGGATAAVDQALVQATDVPLRVAAAAGEALDLCAALAPEARASALADLVVAAGLAWTALESASVIARANAAEIRDPELAGAPARQMERLLAEGRRARARVEDAAAARAGGRG